MKTIVWDLDDVLNNLMESWLALGWSREHPESLAVYEDLRTNPPLRALSTTMSAYLESLDRFRLSHAGQKLRPNPAVMAWFEAHGGKFHHHVLTARPAKTVAPASTWVFTHFGRWIRHFHFVPSVRPGEPLPEYDRTKAELLARIGPVDFFIDDSAENVRAVEDLGIRARLFPQPWNPTAGSVEEILEELTSHAEKTEPDIAAIHSRN